MTAPGGPTHTPAGTAELAALVRDASARRARLRIRGAGTWMDAGHPVRDAEPLSLEAFRGVDAYTPGDLTISVGAATTLAELDEVTRAHRQWCPLLPWGDDTGTVGATVATATDGPCAAALGRPRDLVLGVEAVDGRARTLVAGGRVVKNVAGFDLTRALTGSWGTLAVLTRLHLRLRALPPGEESWVLHADDAGVERLRAALDAFARGPLAPMAIVRLGAASAGALGFDGSARALVRVGGNAAFVAESRSRLAACGDARPADPAIWNAVRARLAPEDRARRWDWNALSLRIRERFDPARLLNPGLLGDAA